MERSAVVFGGHSPIAIGISKKLAERYQVIHVSRTPDSNLASEFEFHEQINMIKLNLLDHKAIAEFVRTEIVAKKIVIETIIFAQKSSYSSISEAIALEIEASIFMIDEVLRVQENQDLTAVVFLGSPAATSVLADQNLAYHLAKACVNQTIKYLSVRYAHHGVRFNGVSPGSFVDKPRSKDFFQKNSEYKDKIKNFIPTGDFVQLSKIAEVVNFLSGNKSEGVNGQILSIDGGYSNMEPSNYFITSNHP